MVENHLSTVSVETVANLVSADGVLLLSGSWSYPSSGETAKIVWYYLKTVQDCSNSDSSMYLCHTIY